MELKYTGIILNKKDIGEADRIYTIYTLETGKIQAKAVGVKKPGAKLAGALENFTLADITIAKKRGMGKITGSIIENSFSNVKNNLEAVSGVFRAERIFDRMIGMEEKDEKAFCLLLNYLEAMEKSAGCGRENIFLLSEGFIFKLLDLLGYKIEANICVHCGSKFENGENYFSAEQGGIICKKCASGLNNLIKINVNSIKLIRIFFANNLKSLLKLKIGKNEIKDLELISKVFLDWIAK